MFSGIHVVMGPDIDAAYEREIAEAWANWLALKAEKRAMHRAFLKEMVRARSASKSRENRVRRLAVRRGYGIWKSGPYHYVVERRCDHVPAVPKRLANRSGTTLDAVEAFLTAAPPQRLPADKVRENRLRRVATRRGFRFVKPRHRDHSAVGYGTYQLWDGDAYQHAATLDAVEAFLNGA